MPGCSLTAGEGLQNSNTCGCLTLLDFMTAIAADRSDDKRPPVAYLEKVNLTDVVVTRFIDRCYSQGKVILIKALVDKSEETRRAHVTRAGNGLTP